MLDCKKYITRGCCQGAKTERAGPRETNATKPSAKIHPSSPPTLGLVPEPKAPLPPKGPVPREATAQRGTTEREKAAGREKTAAGDPDAERGWSGCR